MALAALVVSNILLALGPWLVRLADVGPVAAGFWRLTLALPILLPLGLMRGGLGRLRAAPALVLALVVGGLFFAADLSAWHGGILRTRLANATLFGNAASFLFPLYGFLVARRLPSRMQGTALVLAGIGTALLLGRSLELSQRTFEGDLLCLLAGLFYTVYLITVDRARAAISPLPALLVITASGALPLLIAANALGEQIVPHAWGPLLALAIGSQVIGQGLLVAAVGALDPLVIGLAFLIQPIVSAAIGWGRYGERLGLADLAGGVAIAAALVLVRSRPAPTSS